MQETLQLLQCGGYNVGVPLFHPGTLRLQDAKLSLQIAAVIHPFCKPRALRKALRS